MSLDLSLASAWLREDILVVSGGWLGEVVPLIADATGIWDIIVLAGLFIPSWVILRISDSLTSMILGFTFDVTIPLQNQLNPNRFPKHEQHLASFWPIQFFATGVEVLCFFIVHPDLFTLVVCLKTTCMTALWLSRRSDGTFLATAAGKAGVARGDRPPRGNEQPVRPSTRRPRGEEGDEVKTRNRRGDPKDPRGRPNGPKNPTAPESNSEPPKSEQRKPKTQEEKWDEALKNAGYDDEQGRKAMMEKLNDMNDPERREKQLKNWLSETRPEKKKKTMEDMKKRSKQKAESAKKKKEAERGEDGMDPPSIAGVHNPKTVGRQGRTPDKVNPGDFKGHLMDIYPEDSYRRAPKPPQEDDGGGPGNNQTINFGRTNPLANPANGLFGQYGQLVDPLGGGQHHHLVPAPEGVIPGHQRPSRRWEGWSRRAETPPREQDRRWLDPIDEAAPMFQYNGLKEEDKPAPWEKVLPHDSLELLDYHLRNFRADFTLRAQMLLDLMDQTDTATIRSMVNSWKNVIIEQITVDKKTMKSDERWRRIIQPYHGLFWEPRNPLWQGGTPEHQAISQKLLDKLNWKCREAGFEPEVRRAMIRDLMSQTHKGFPTLYDKLKNAAIGLTEDGSRPLSDEDKAKVKETREALTKEYLAKTDFGGQYCVSENEIKEIMDYFGSFGVAKVPTMRHIRKVSSEEELKDFWRQWEQEVVRVAGYNR